MRSGIMAEFDSPEALERAYDRLGRMGCTRLHTWTPYPVRGVIRRTWPLTVPWLMLAAGLLGGALGYFVQWWCNAVDFPINVGGRPLHSAPAFIPITFESAVLAASLTGFVALLALCGLPRLSHPVFEIDGFERATVDRFWLGIDLADPKFDDRLSDELTRMGALRCHRIGAQP
jgi:hypothetical protein